MTCSDCLSRREFLARTATVAAAAALTACGDGQIGGSGVTGVTGTTSIKVADFPGLATTGTLVVIDTQRVAKRTGTSTFTAFSRTCTHEGFRINVVELAAPFCSAAQSVGSKFQCCNHGSEFDANGNVIQGPASRHLDILATAYDATTDLLTIG